MYKTLNKGKKSFDVIALQQLLNKADKENKLLVDGDFGTGTEKALKKFQENNGLSPDGICGITTYQKLYEVTQINTLGLKNFVYSGMSEDQYYPEYQKKDIIALHHTAGSGNPYYVRDHWQKNKNKVGTFLIIGGKGEYDGVNMQVYQHPDQWAYHLNIWGNFNVYEGRKELNKSHETKMAKRSIGVEVCNYGYLSFIDGEFWFMSRGKKIKSIPEEDVIDYGKYGFRGKRFYQRYTNKQIDSLKDFITKASSHYGIILDKPKGGFSEKWFDYSWEATRGEQNIFSHSSVRSKSDMHPQPELIDMLNTL